MIPKYRAWVKEDKEMWPVHAIVFDYEIVWVEEPDDENPSGCLCFDNVILMQSTGLKDNNGKEIFEGDILKFRDELEDRDYEGYVDGSTKIDNFVEITKEKTEFTFGDAKYPESSLFYLMEYEHSTFEQILEEVRFQFEIVGNIYENPELLK